MSRLTVLLVLAACTLRPYDFDASATATATDVSTSTTTAPDPTTTSATTSAPATTTTSTTTNATSSTTDDTGASFVRPPDGVPTKECDQWIEDCPEGQKCMPYSSDGDPSWDSLKCVSIVPNPADVGAPCEVFGAPNSGEDTCDKHALCWYVDPDTLTGTCLAMCDGSPDQPKCDPGTACQNGSFSVLTLCFPTCDPLAPDCPDSDICIPNPQNVANFVCTFDASGDAGQAFDVCEYANACDPGLLCANSALAAECDQLAVGCCLPFCDLFAPDTCPGQDQQCLPWFDEDMAPAGLEHVGICGLPQ
jgi:hypothetical protein